MGWRCLYILRILVVLVSEGVCALFTTLFLRAHALAVSMHRGASARDAWMRRTGMRAFWARRHVYRRSKQCILAQARTCTAHAEQQCGTDVAHTGGTAYRATRFRKKANSMCQGMGLSACRKNTPPLTNEGSDCNRAPAALQLCEGAIR